MVTCELAYYLTNTAPVRRGPIILQSPEANRTLVFLSVVYDSHFSTDTEPASITVSWDTWT